MPQEPPPRKDSYVIDPESGTEMARLMNQDRLLTKGMGGIFPEEIDLSNVNDILDIACGPGGWVLDVAHHYPEINIVGVDISRIVVEYARAQAASQGLNNATFRIMNILEPLDFPDDSFDLINARSISWLTPRVVWPQLISECMRILRPGGIIRITECEVNFATTPAFMKLADLGTQAAKIAGLGFSPDGHQMNVTPKLGRLLRDAGCQSIQKMAHVSDFSVGEEAYYGFYENYLVVAQLTQPFLLKTGVTTQEELDHLYREMLIEMMSDDFCGLWFQLTVWGQKPQS